MAANTRHGMGSRMKPQVVIVRKDKRIRHKFLHVVAFALTGGASGVVTAAEVVTNAQYNARTRKMQGIVHPRIEFSDEERAYMAAHVPAEHRRPRA